MYVYIGCGIMKRMVEIALEVPYGSIMAENVVFRP